MTNTISSSNSTRSTIATYFTYDHIKHQIIGSEQNFKKSGIPGSDQDKALMAALDAHPNYTLCPIAPKVKKQTYAGLTCDLICEYVEIKGSEAQKAELAELIDNDEVFATIKSWFLDYFKCGFSVEKAKEKIAYHKLNARKAKVRTAIRVRTVKAAPAVEAPAAVEPLTVVEAPVAAEAPAVVEMPAAANF